MGIISSKGLPIYSFALASFAAPVVAWAQERSFDLPAQPATRSIPEFARQARVQIVSSGKILRGITTPPLNGQYDVKAALRLLLRGTAIRDIANDGATITLASAAAGQVNRQRSAAPASTKLAFQAASSAVAQTDQPGGLEDIVVTAQRREESLQRVPIAITAVSSDTLAASGIVRSDDLVKIVPGLVNHRQMRGNTPYIRGVGTQDTSAGNEAAVATYVDGIYYMDTANTAFSFNNIERVEVLKGPQGTLFGRNATGGLISIVTKDPEFHPSINGSIGFERFGLIDGSLYTTGGVGDIAADLSFAIKRQADGWGRNIDNGDEVNKRRETQVRGKILWTPSDSDKIILIGDWSSNEGDIGLSRNSVEGSVLAGNFPYRGSGFDTRGDFTPQVSGYSTGVSLRYIKDLGWGSLTALSAYRYGRTRLRYDQDLVANRFAFHVDYTQKIWTLQNELILTGKSDVINWTAGLFMFQSDAKYDALLIRSGLSPAANYDLFNGSGLKSYAVYGQATYKVTSATRLTVGGRYTVDKRDQDGRQISAAGNPVGIGTILGTRSDDRNFKKPTWRLALDQDLLRGILAYASYNRGFKSGVYNLTSLTAPIVFPEQLDAYEIGLKSELFGRTLRLNASAFHYDYKNIQLTKNEGGIPQLLNAAQGRLKGLELEATYSPRLDFGKLQFGGTFSLLDAKYTKFPSGPTTVPRATGGNAIVPADLSGREMISSPDWTFTLNADLSFPTSFGSAGGNLNLFNTASYAYEAEGRLRQKSYSTVNAQIFLGFGDDEQYRVRVYARNLTNTKYFAYQQALAIGDVGTRAEPRIIGGAFDFRF